MYIHIHVYVCVHGNKEKKETENILQPVLRSSVTSSIKSSSHWHTENRVLMLNFLKSSDKVHL